MNILRHWVRVPAAALVAAGLAAALASPARAHHVEIERCGLAEFRNDLVAFHSSGKAVPGKATYRAKEDGAVFWFATQANLRRFRANPARYMPKFSKFCAQEVQRRKARKKG